MVGNRLLYFLHPQWPLFYFNKIKRCVHLLLISMLLSCPSMQLLSQNTLDTLAFAQKHWQLTGVEGGIPKLSATKPLVRIKPGESIQHALNKAAKAGGGLVLFEPGIHRIYQTVAVPSGVVLRGVHRDSSRIHVYIKAPFAEHESGKRVAAFSFKKISHSGIEHLTIQYKAAGFEPNDKDSMNAVWDRTVFHVQEMRDTLLFVDLLLFDSSVNGWVKDCNLLWAGCDPIHITASSHITCRGNFVDRAYNKADKGQGYYNIIRSKYVLIENEIIRRLRHFSIHYASQFVVVRNCYFEVDINFHNGDSGYNLIEGNTIRIPNWHSWSAFQRGDPRQHKPPGPWNIVYNNDALNKDGKAIASDKKVVFRINEHWAGGVVKIFALPLPVGGSYYHGL